MSSATKQGMRLGGRKFKWDFWHTVTLVAMLFAIMFICYPFLYLFQNALTDKEGHLTLAHFIKFFNWISCFIFLVKFIAQTFAFKKIFYFSFYCRRCLLFFLLLFCFLLAFLCLFLF